MGIENLIRDALLLPNDVIAYHVGRELAELYSEKKIIHGQNWYFDLDAFVRANQCSVVEERLIFNDVRTDWEGIGKPTTKQTENAWLNVLWQGKLFEVVLITWSDGCYRRRHHWIVGDDKKSCEALLTAVCEWSSEIRGEILVYQDGYFQKNKELFKSIKSATFENLILTESLKESLKSDFIQFFNSRDIYRRYGISWKRGALFVGPPGNGKTHTIKALINYLDKPCIYVRGFNEANDIEEENMAEVFKRARMNAPCIVVLEDLDSMINEKTRSFLLNELDGFQENTGIVVVATTNYPEKLDPAILSRPSRFDRKYQFDLPGAPERHAYLNKWRATLDGDLELAEPWLESVIEITEGFSFAYLKELIVSTMVEVACKSEPVEVHDVMRNQALLLRKQLPIQSSRADD
jgi:AAA+ superfamily predicted ATPase